MLTLEEKEKLVRLFDTTLTEIREETARLLREGQAPWAVLQGLVPRVAAKLDFESKLLLGTAYQWMKERTLAEPFFTEKAGRKVAFYEWEIESRLREACPFALPKSEREEWERCRRVKTAYAIGGIGVVGAGWGLVVGSWGPPMGAVLLIAALLTTCRVKPGLLMTRGDLERFGERYLARVRQGFQVWVDDLEAYYDKQVETVKHQARNA